MNAPLRKGLCPSLNNKYSMYCSLQRFITWLCKFLLFYCIRMAKSWEKKKEELLRRSPELFENPQKILIVPGLVSE